MESYEPLHQLVLTIDPFAGAFFAGVLYASTFTLAPCALMLLILAQRMPLMELGIIAGLGSIIVDYVIFLFFKKNLNQEIIEMYHSFEGHHLSKLMHMKHFAWTLPVVGGLIIASPLPDRIGVSLMSLSKMSSLKFLLVALVLDIVGIHLILLLSEFLKP